MDINRCERCFEVKDSGTCHHCGYPYGSVNDSHQLCEGTLLRSRYRIGRVLGQGGFGITYLGWDTLLDKKVAVKEFYPRSTVSRRSDRMTVHCSETALLGSYESSRKRFLREARALAAFGHIPEIVNIMDFVEENDTAYIVMEYVQGMNLAEYVCLKGGKISAEEALRILKPIMEALATVHKAGIIHRDISPDNIVLHPTGGAKLLDFGAAREVENPELGKELTHSTEAIIKHGFAPMEQYHTRGGIGPWTDEYAICATIYYCLTGQIPENALVRVTEGIDPDWSGIPGLTAIQRAALEKGMSVRAKDRWKDMRELIRALFVSYPRPVTNNMTGVRREAAGGILQSSPPKSTSPKIAPIRKRHRNVLWMITVILVFICGVVGALLYKVIQKDEQITNNDPQTEQTGSVYNNSNVSEIKIKDFFGVTGDVDGSVILSFESEGPEPITWVISYSAEGEDTRIQRFAGHSVTIYDLTVAKTYTFQLSTSEGNEVTGQNTLIFTASNCIVAQNLDASLGADNSITVCWDIPEETNVENWIIRCYNDKDMDDVVNTSDNEVTFFDIDFSVAHHVIVTAAGMSRYAQITIPENPRSITSVFVNEDDPLAFTVSWEFSGSKPSDGWYVIYTLDGSEEKSVIKCSENKVYITPRVPGAEYTFEFQTADGEVLFNRKYHYICPDAELFMENSFNPETVSAKLLVTPNINGWSSADISERDYTNRFALGQPISIVLCQNNPFYIPKEEVTILFVVRNAQNQVIQSCLSVITTDWHDLWFRGDVHEAELDVHAILEKMGDYTLGIYINGKYVTSTLFTITE